MTDLPFVDPEEGLFVLLGGQFPDATIGSFPETEVALNLDYISIDLLDGNQDYFQDNPIIDIDVFSATRAQSKKLAGEVSALLLGYPWTVRVGARRFTIDSVGVIRRPVKEPWDDENVRRTGATYQLAVRR